MNKWHTLKNEEFIKWLKTGTANSLETLLNDENLTCQGCIQGTAELPWMKKKSSSQTCFQLISRIHSDIYVADGCTPKEGGVRGILFHLLLNIQTGLLFIFWSRNRRLCNFYWNTKQWLCDKLVITFENFVQTMAGNIYRNL